MTKIDLKLISSTQPVVDYLIQALSQRLQAGQAVTWLVGGGSGITVSLAVAQGLRQQGIDLTKLSVSLTDERYGALGHANENWQQLLDQGFALPGAKLYRVLTGDDRATTTQKFEALLHQLIDQADYALALFGIGADGHTAGIKPGSPAANSTNYAADFTGQDFERITMTGPAIAHLDEAVIYAVGAEKQPALHRLLSEDWPVTEQPAQLLKTVAKSTLFTDVKEG